jgi:hypothetical protein
MFLRSELNRTATPIKTAIPAIPRSDSKIVSINCEIGTVRTARSAPLILERKLRVYG